MFKIAWAYIDVYHVYHVYHVYDLFLYIQYIHSVFINPIKACSDTPTQTILNEKNANRTISCMPLEHEEKKRCLF